MGCAVGPESSEPPRRSRARRTSSACPPWTWGDPGLVWGKVPSAGRRPSLATSPCLCGRSRGRCACHCCCCSSCQTRHQRRPATERHRDRRRTGWMAWQHASAGWRVVSVTEAVSWPRPPAGADGPRRPGTCPADVHRRTRSWDSRPDRARSGGSRQRTGSRRTAATPERSCSPGSGSWAGRGGAEGCHRRRRWDRRTRAC